MHLLYKTHAILRDVEINKCSSDILILSSLSHKLSNHVIKKKTTAALLLS